MDSLETYKITDNVTTVLQDAGLDNPQNIADVQVSFIPQSVVTTVADAKAAAGLDSDDEDIELSDSQSESEDMSDHTRRCRLRGPKDNKQDRGTVPRNPNPQVSTRKTKKDAKKTGSVGSINKPVDPSPSALVGTKMTGKSV